MSTPKKPKAEETSTANNEIQKEHGDTPGTSTTLPDPLEREQTNEAEEVDQVDPNEPPEDRAEDVINRGRIWT